MLRARYLIERELCTSSRLVIRDVARPGVDASITNAAEWVVANLTSKGCLNSSLRLFYFDSYGELSELVHRDGAFCGFKPVTDLIAFLTDA